MITKKEKSLSENVETIANLEGKKVDSDQLEIKKTITRKRTKGKIEKIVKTGTSETKTEITYPQPKQIIWYRRLIEVLYSRYEGEQQFMKTKAENPEFSRTLDYKNSRDYENEGLIKTQWIKQLSYIIGDKTPKWEEVDPIIEDLLDPDKPLVKIIKDETEHERYSLNANGRMWWENKKSIKESDPEWKIDSLMDQSCLPKF